MRSRCEHSCDDRNKFFFVSLSNARTTLPKKIIVIADPKRDGLQRVSSILRMFITKGVFSILAGSKTG